MVQAIDTQRLIHLVKEALEDKKAENVVVLDLTGVSDTLDYFVIATGTSQPHLQALERAVREKLLEDEGIRANNVEGPSPRWVLLDYGPVLVHLMSAEAREYYDLEGFWADAKRI
ncbi:ribosome silencing factor [Meiothermus ruber]|jgi:ribosome-associated protein|uniref:Ribosomal silencing factor RsfS n=1 Tax=Meiothermus ruber (strain ATCC 35948 / DSM 1279 / VKM B-1258 / 21) TaxID=504728 RepID=D3PKV4_MEIRD|nr:ribosome silencing factor [Meiothermus ruber]ADD28978.1 iojap-like protein [Meiothermus ruber DSM 1279]AGK05572.1 iojap family protein [Meiothermus ruber DSM 1279]MCL6528689.1 ribosome silencing factor [Meiothermus ruber]MCX7802166.1 ribosome silencing factor [Meiothermus ruber]GAO75898.1 iojap family protein [Meiothermus ruber H328]